MDSITDNTLRLPPPDVSPMPLHALHIAQACEAADDRMPPTARRRLSVVIPVYNGAETIGGLLDALLPQCDARCEIIVVDFHNFEERK